MRSRFLYLPIFFLGSTILLLFTCLAEVHAQQNPQPYFRNYSTEHGLPSSEVHCVLQDSQGYMWFGTDNGAARFDGYEFQTFGAQDGLTSNVVFDIHEDGLGRIWFGTLTGEAFILEGDTIVPYIYNDLVLKHRKHYGKATLSAVLDDGTTYFELYLFGILQIDQEGNDSLITTISPLSGIIYDLDNLPRSLHTPIARPQDETYEYWVQQKLERQIVQLDLLSESSRKQIDLAFSNTPCYGNFKVCKLSGEDRLITFCQQIYYFQGDQLLWTIPYSFEASRIIVDETQMIWVCGIKGQGGRRYSSLDNLRHGIYDLFLEGLSISNVKTDKNGGLWITSLEQGVFYCQDQESLIYDSRFGFSENQVKSITAKGKNDLFVGCENGDIFQLDLQTNTLTQSFANPYEYHNYDLLYQEEKDALWGNGSYWQAGDWHHVKISYLGKYKSEFLRTTKLQKLHFNADRDIIGCHNGGFLIIDTKIDSVTYYSAFNNLRERTFAVFTDQNQTLWIGNSRGIFAFRDSVLVSPEIDHPAFHIRVEDIDEMPDGSLVFGTKGLGVVKWHGESILQATTHEGLTADMIEDVHVDEKGILWVGTLNGLNKVTFDKNGQATVRRFTISNGLPSNEIYQIKSFHGQLWLCTAKGLVKFHEPAEEIGVPTPILQSLILNGASTSLDLNQSFPSDQNNLSFQFLAINYQQNGQIPYRYRLSETDRWQSTQNRTVNYPKLSPGSYHFEVQSQNQDGYWSESATHVFEILPPWWETWWARLLLLVVILTGLIVYQRELRKRLQKEASFQQQITDLERSALQAQMNPHFIFNCLNSIQNFILQNDRKQAVEYLSRFARLVRHNLDASVRGKISLEEELSLLDNYLALERERFEHRFDYRLVVEPTLNQSFIHFPPLLIQPYVENAIIHGLAKQENQGLIEVHFSKENEYLLVKIRDNGPGYDPDLHQENNSRHHSVGMSITEKRLKLLSHNREEKVKILTSVGKNQGSGTEVDIYIGLS